MIDTDTLIADRYRLRELLGRGGMAEVWAALDERLDRPVAVKVLARELATQPEMRGRFAREARAAARLSHPNVVAVYDSGEHDGCPYLVMELVEGESLHERLNRGPLHPDEARGVAQDVLGALAAAHRAGVIHRDIKPANVLVEPSGRAKLADFGIATLTDPASAVTGTDVLVGTPSYLAPERIDGRPATPQSDIYAVGVVLYEALTGARPFGGETPVQIAIAARAGAAPLRERRPGIDPVLADVIDRAMAPDPAQRFRSASAMAAALAAAPTTLAAAPADATVVVDRFAARPARRPLAARPAASRSGARAGGRLAGVPFAAVIALVAVLAAAVGVAAWSAQREPAPSGLAAEMRELAPRLRSGDGPAGPLVADRLLVVADALERGGDAATPASLLLADVERWRAAGDLLPTATAKVRELLLAVPGVDTPPPTTAPPVVEHEDEDDEDDEDDEVRGRGRGKRGKD